MVSVFNIRLKDDNLIKDFNSWKADHIIFDKIYRDPHIDLTNDYDRILSIKDFDNKTIFSCFNDGYIICNNDTSISFASNVSELRNYMRNNHTFLEEADLYNFDYTSTIK